MTRRETAQLAWSMIDTLSRDPAVASQLSPETWLELGRYMAENIRAERAELVSVAGAIRLAIVALERIQRLTETVGSDYGIPEVADLAVKARDELREAEKTLSQGAQEAPRAS